MRLPLSALHINLHCQHISPTIRTNVMHALRTLLPALSALCSLPANDIALINADIATIRDHSWGNKGAHLEDYSEYLIQSDNLRLKINYILYYHRSLLRGYITIMTTSRLMMIGMTSSTTPLTSHKCIRLTNSSGTLFPTILQMNPYRKKTNQIILNLIKNHHNSSKVNKTTN